MACVCDSQFPSKWQERGTDFKNAVINLTPGVRVHPGAKHIVFVLLYTHPTRLRHKRSRQARFVSRFTKWSQRQSFGRQNKQKVSVTCSVSSVPPRPIILFIVHVPGQHIDVHFIGINLFAISTPYPLSYPAIGSTSWPVGRRPCPETLEEMSPPKHIHTR